MLNITEKKLENARMELQISVPVEKVELEYKAVFDKFKNYAKIDGFRKGKAPLHMVEARYRKEADQEVAENLLKSMFLEAVQEKQYNPIAYPQYEFERISRQEPFSFKATFEVPPTVELGKYKGLSADEQVCEIVDEDLEAEITAMRERLAKIDKKEEGAAVQNGDLVKIKVKRVDDVADAERDSVDFKEYQIVVGRSKDASALDKHIDGMKVNEEKEVEVKYPKDYYLTDLAGQKVKYLVVVTEINSMELPPLDDEFAKKMGYDTVDQYRSKTREYLVKYTEEKTKGDAKAQILKQIVEDSKYDIPESMIQNEMNRLFKRTCESVGYYSENLDEFASLMGVEPEAFRNQLHDEATRTIKTTLALSEIAKKEEMKVDENRYKEVVENIAKRNNKTVEEIEKIITENESRENIEMELLLDGAMEFIYENAKVKKLKPITFEEFARTRGRR
ncbi:MAG TPA: trigger factor [Spirochaetota bacterium]|nr:trigger factor [Spirochaetota bacterium]HPV40782.1 trigger factor [Spirochaetota bacterium]